MIVECTLNLEQLKKIATPTHLATQLLINGGYYFAEVREGENKVSAWNMDEFVGSVEYIQTNDLVVIRVTDAPQQMVLTDQMLYIAQSFNTSLAIK